MVDDNADRVHGPGQQGVPERDIEPLWPPEPGTPDALAAQPWAVTTQPTLGPPPAVPAPRVGPPAPAPVDLDQPFTLDRPPPTPPLAGTGAPAWPVVAESPAPVPAAGTPTQNPPEMPPPATVTPFTAPVTPPTAAVTPAPVAPVPADVPPAAEAHSGAAGATANGARSAGESPWAQPPQRATTTGESATDGRTADAGPPGAEPADGRPATAPHTGPTQAGSPQQQLPHPGPPHPQAGQPHAQLVPPHQQAGPPQHQAGPPHEQAGAGPQAEDTAPRLGPFPPSPGIPGYPPPAVPAPAPQPQAGGWYPPAWQQGVPGVSPVPQQPYQEADGVTRVPPAQQGWTPEAGPAPTAEDFARRRQARPVDPVATMGVRAVVNRMGLLRLAPGRHEQEIRRDIEMVRRNFGGLRQVTVVNPKGGAGKTVAILLLAMTFGQKRGGYVLAWDNNETQGTLGMRAQQDFHSRTVRDMLRDLGQFQGAHGRVGDLSQYVRSQGEGMFDVLASDESATGGEMLTAAAFAEIRDVVSRFYKLIFVDTGNNVRAQNWQAAMDATDQLVVTMSARNDSAETAARMLDHLEQSGRQRLVRQAVTVVSMPPSRKEIDLPAIQAHFAARTRAVLLAPYERLIDTGEPIRYGQLSSATRDAWLKIAASVAEGL
ncbi:MinD/ParA family ATP-binding protein [Micromonospora mirobrigensis]|uniref:MinD-like ATPase involved in chromosome partitioning or flagellar assembly n=1 Tax=Micromonospora mirobrigensis TaxID=262898 RepID=A0A1C4VPT1_9ACTN|nr:chromosome partitioning protein [Micromonospora mirobrigensis]SCE85739.1 MinD-like ATPase involved in chromosome partitioning or flagellar assembly [Micromonospora mirobrigensis]